MTRMRRLLVAVAFSAVGLLIAPASPALAGGSSDTSGEGFHCYAFFVLPDGEFAQVMVNDEEPDEVIKKIEEYIEKYENDEGGTLALTIGNIEGIEDDICQPAQICLTCEEACAQEAKAVFDDCIKQGGSEAKCRDKENNYKQECLRSCPLCSDDDDCSPKNQCCHGYCIPLGDDCL